MGSVSVSTEQPLPSVSVSQAKPPNASQSISGAAATATYLNRPGHSKQRKSEYSTSSKGRGTAGRGSSARNNGAGNNSARDKWLSVVKEAGREKRDRVRVLYTDIPYLVVVVRMVWGTCTYYLGGTTVRSHENKKGSLLLLRALNGEQAQS